MKPFQKIQILLFGVLFLIPSFAHPTVVSTARTTPGFKMLVIGNRAELPVSMSATGVREGPFVVIDRAGRIRKTLSKLDAGVLDELGRELPSGVYVLSSASGATGQAFTQSDEDWRTDTGDIDDDGDEDIVTVGYLTSARVLINEGGAFIDESDRVPPISVNAFDVDLVDVTGDSLPDLFVAVNDSQNRLFMNDGTGHFLDSTLTHLPVDSAASQGASWGDVDGDGDNDIFIVNFADPLFPSSKENQLLINDGSGHFSDETNLRFQFQPRLDTSMDCLVFDAEGDHDMDLVIINDNVNGDESRILINNGSGFFTDETSQRFPAVTGSSMRVSAADMDGDEKPDLYIAKWFWEINFLWMNDGSGRFYDETQLRTPTGSSVDSSWSHACDVADIEGDGDNDVVVGNLTVFFDSLYAGKGRNRLLVNDGFGFFTDRTFQIFPNVEDTTVDVNFFDAGGTGLIDLYVTNLGESDVLLIDPGENVGVDRDEPLTPPVPGTALLRQNYPNPFNPQTTIRFSVPGYPAWGNRVSLAVYDLKGRLIRRLVDRTLLPGDHRVVWDGRNEQGTKVASGVYLSRMIVGGRSTSIKMTLLK